MPTLKRTWHPDATFWRQLTTELDPRQQLIEEAAAVSPQIFRYEFAWKLRLGRRPRSSCPVGSRTHSPPRLWKLWKTQLNRRLAGLTSRRVPATLTTPSPAWGSVGWGRATDCRKERELLQHVTPSPFRPSPCPLAQERDADGSSYQPRRRGSPDVAPPGRLKGWRSSRSVG